MKIITINNHNPKLVKKTLNVEFKSKNLGVININKQIK